MIKKKRMKKKKKMKKKKIMKKRKKMITKKKMRKIMKIVKVNLNLYLQKIILLKMQNKYQIKTKYLKIKRKILMIIKKK